MHLFKHALKGRRWVWAEVEEQLHCSATCSPSMLPWKAMSVRLRHWRAADGVGCGRRRIPPLLSECHQLLEGCTVMGGGGKGSVLTEEMHKLCGCCCTLYEPHELLWPHLLLAAGLSATWMA